MAGPAGVPVHIEISEILVGGECPLGLRQGQSWTVADGFVPGGMCATAWNSIQPYVVALRYGGTFPWSDTKEIAACCPDAANPVVFQLTVEE